MSQDLAGIGVDVFPPATSEVTYSTVKMSGRKRIKQTVGSGMINN